MALRDELLARMGLAPEDLSDVDSSRIDAAVSDAEALVFSEVSPATATEWEATLPAVVRVVLLKAARREYDNGAGYREETLGEHAVSVAAEFAVGVYLTAGERALIRREAGLDQRKRGYTGSIRTPSAYSEGRP